MNYERTTKKSVQEGADQTMEIGTGERMMVDYIKNQTNNLKNSLVGARCKWEQNLEETRLEDLSTDEDTASSSEEDMFDISGFVVEVVENRGSLQPRVVQAVINNTNERIFIRKHNFQIINRKMEQIREYLNIKFTVGVQIQVREIRPYGKNECNYQGVILMSEIEADIYQLLQMFDLFDQNNLISLVNFADEEELLDFREKLEDFGRDKARWEECCRLGLHYIPPEENDLQEYENEDVEDDANNNENGVVDYETEADWTDLDEESSESEVDSYHSNLDAEEKLINNEITETEEFLVRASESVAESYHSNMVAEEALINEIKRTKEFLVRATESEDSYDSNLDAMEKLAKNKITRTEKFLVRASESENSYHSNMVAEKALINEIKRTKEFLVRASESEDSYHSNLDTEETLINNERPRTKESLALRVYESEDSYHSNLDTEEALISNEIPRTKESLALRVYESEDSYHSNLDAEEALISNEIPLTKDFVEQFCACACCVDGSQTDKYEDKSKYVVMEVGDVEKMMTQCFSKVLMLKTRKPKKRKTKQMKWKEISRKIMNEVCNQTTQTTSDQGTQTSFEEKHTCLIGLF